MKRLIALPVAAALCLLCTASCVDTLVGKSIKFSGRTSPEASATKTAYGDTVREGSKKYQRIDWEVDDQIKIYMLNDGTTAGNPEAMTYRISEATSNGRYSEATLDVVGGNGGLQWGNGQHSFMAAYPDNTVYSGSNNTFSFTIPGTQNLQFKNTSNGVTYFDPEMDKAFMFAGALYSEPQSKGIDLDFQPAVTTFDFTVGANTEMVVKGFRMETIKNEGSSWSWNDKPQGQRPKAALNGGTVASFDFNVASDNHNIPASYSGPEISLQQVPVPEERPLCSTTVVFDQQAVISAERSINFKVFAVPVNITGVRIIFELNDGTTGLDRTASLELKQNDSWVEFTGGNLIRISGLLIPGAEWFINFGYPREEQWIIHPDIEIGVE